MDMKPLGDAREHYWKVIKMADAVGVSLVDAWDDGRLSPDAYDKMISRCRGCTKPGDCGRLLDTHKPLAEAPGYCANKDQFEAL